MLIKFAVKAQGISHVEKGAPCQDAAIAHLGLDNTVGVACVADGHGGEKYFRSARGAELAVNIASKSILDFFGTILSEKADYFSQKVDNEEASKGEILSKLKQLEGNIIYNWRKAVADDFAKDPLNETELEFCNEKNITIDELEKPMFIYGTTLLAGLVSDNFWFTIQIGDGLCVLVENEENIKVPIQEDERLGFGKTTSLSESDAIKSFRESFGFCKIQGLTLATDGISDSFEPEKYLQFNKELFDKFSRFPEKAERELQEFIPIISERGSRDDVSMAGIFRMIESKPKETTIENDSKEMKNEEQVEKQEIVMVEERSKIDINV